jgi:pectate lyase
VDDVVVRCLTVRSLKDSEEGLQRNCVSQQSGARFIWDHCSFHYGTDETFTLTASNIASGSLNPDFFGPYTVQRCMIACCLRPHSTGSLIRGVSDWIGSAHISLHHNLWAFQYHRNPEVQTSKDVEIVNNLVYNWVNRVGHDRNLSSNNEAPYEVDYVNNFWKAGPGNSSTAHGNIRRVRNELGDGPHSIHAVGNVHTPLNGDNPVADQERLWAERNESDTEWIQMRSEWFRATRLPLPPVPVTITDAGIAVFNDVVGDIGNNFRVTEDGSFVARLDDGDDWILGHVNAGTGKSGWNNEDQSDFFGVPTIPSETPYTDTDGDGIGDAWAAAHMPGGAEAFDVTTGGWTYLEHFLNGTVP